jgi:hypothetical protein
MLYPKQEMPSIIFKSRNLPVFRYILEPKYSFVNYISNIGGIISLWFGLAVIDLSIIMRRIIILLKIYYYHYLMTDYLLEALKKTKIFEFFTKILELVGKLLYRLKYYNWKLWLQIVCIPCLLYQIFEITQTYLNFATNVNVELIPILDNNFISMQRIPAITICHENNLKDIFFNRNLKNFDRMIQDVISKLKDKNVDKDLNLEIETKIQLNNNQKILLFKYQTIFKGYFPNKYKKILELMIKYLENDNYGNSLIINNSSLFEEMEFYSNQFDCYLRINQSLNCDEFSKIEPTFSYLGKCNSYLLKSSDSFGLKSKTQLRNRENLIGFITPRLFRGEYMRNVFYIHSSDSMPSLSYNDWFRVQSIFKAGFFNEYFFKKLEPPYDTNCRKYVNKTRADCLNDCFIKFQNSSKICINDEQFFITFKIDKIGFKPNISFGNCDENSRKQNTSINLIKICSKQCPVSCEEQIFIFEKQFIGVFLTLNTFFNFYKNYYTSIIYAPNMLFVEYIIKVANLMSLWHGIDFTSIRDKFFDLINLFLTKSKIFHIFDGVLQLLMSSDKTRLFVLVWIKAFRLIVGNSKVLRN